MGYGRYDADAYRSITDRRRTESTQEVFRQRVIHPSMDPMNVRQRESRDSDNHPNSTGIIFALDQTGSMQDIPELLARDHLPRFMETLLDQHVIPDPQVMIVGIGDATTGEPAPLQVGQFESEAHLMDQWLTNLYLVGAGGGNKGESYDLAYYFAARHTSMDCWEKRQRKGYLFITGDEPHLDYVEPSVIQRLCGTSVSQRISMEDVIREASRTFHHFFLVPDRRRYQSRGMESHWRPLIGDRLICLEAPEDACLAAAMLIGLTEGTLPDLDAVRTNLSQTGSPREQVERIVRAITPYEQTIAAQLRASRPDPSGAGETGGGKGSKGGKKKSRKKKGKKADRPLS